MEQIRVEGAIEINNGVFNKLSEKKNLLTFIQEGSIQYLNTNESNNDDNNLIDVIAEEILYVNEVN